MGEILKEKNFQKRYLFCACYVCVMLTGIVAGTVGASAAGTNVPICVTVRCGLGDF